MSKRVIWDEEIPLRSLWLEHVAQLACSIGDSRAKAARESGPLRGRRRTYRAWYQGGGREKGLKYKLYRV